MRPVTLDNNTICIAVEYGISITGIDTRLVGDGAHPAIQTEMVDLEW